MTELTRAGDIAAAMLRFSEDAAYPARTGPPEGWPRTTEPAYMFRYSNERVLRSNLGDFLDALPGPALLAPTLTTGMVVLTMQNDLSGAALHASQEWFDNQNSAARAYRFDDNDRVLLEFDDESCVFSMSTLYEWTKRFVVVDVWWTLSRLQGDPRAKASLDLLRPDNRSTKHYRLG